jgi:hypothetical protein
MQQHALFPTLVAEDLNPDNARLKEVFFPNAMKHFTDGFSDEETGALALQTDPGFAPIYKYVTSKAREYLTQLRVDPRIHDINIVKSWLNVTAVTDSPRHNHADAHLTFTYYVNVPSDKQRDIRFFIEKQQNNLYHGMLENNVVDYNVFNSASWGFTPQEGSIFLFPGHLSHSVLPRSSTCPDADTSKEPPVKDLEDLKTRRICVAGDIVLTYNDGNKKYLGLQPVRNWRTF